MQHKVLQTSDLRADAELAYSRQVPLLVMFSQADCPFCMTLIEEILEPMLISGDYNDRVIIREFMIDGEKDIIDFSGKPVEPREVFTRYLMFVTPTILLFDSEGNEIGERQIGINTVDYYGYYLDEAIDAALRTIRLS